MTAGRAEQAGTCVGTGAWGAAVLGTGAEQAGTCVGTGAWGAAVPGTGAGRKIAGSAQPTHAVQEAEGPLGNGATECRMSIKTGAGNRVRSAGEVVALHQPAEVTCLEAGAAVGVADLDTEAGSGTSAWGVPVRCRAASWEEGASSVANLGEPRDLEAGACSAASFDPTQPVEMEGVAGDDGRRSGAETWNQDTVLGRKHGPGLMNLHATLDEGLEDASVPTRRPVGEKSWGQMMAPAALGATKRKRRAPAKFGDDDEWEVLPMDVSKESDGLETAEAEAAMDEQETAAGDADEEPPQKKTKSKRRAAAPKARAVMGMARPPVAENEVTSGVLMAVHGDELEGVEGTSALVDVDGADQAEPDPLTALAWAPHGKDPWTDEHVRTALLAGVVDREWGEAEVQRVKSKCRSFRSREGHIYARLKGRDDEALVPSPAQRVKLSYDCHVRAAHESAGGLGARLRKDGLWWPSMDKLLEALVKRCAACQRANPTWRTVHDPAKTWTVNAPHDRWAIDMLDLGTEPTALGSVGVCVIVDALTRYPFVQPVRSKSAAEAARVLCEAVAALGWPRSLQSDNGGEFIAATITQLCERMRIDKGTITPGNPQSNGLVERCNRMIVEALRRMGEGNPSSWEWDLPVVMHALRSRRSETTGYSPFHLLYGRDVSLFGEWVPAEPLLSTQVEEVAAQMDRLATLWTVTLPLARRNTVATQLKQTRAQNRRQLVGGPLPIGQVVYLRELQPLSKLHNKFMGPLRVRGRDVHGGYLLESLTGVQLVRGVPRQHLKAVSGVEALPGAEPDDAAAFENVLGARVRCGKWQYLVRWADRDEDDETRDEWVPEDNFASAEAMVPFRKMAVVGMDVEDVVMAEGAAGSEDEDVAMEDAIVV